MMMNRRKNILY